MRKTNPKGGEQLSMGYGFVEFDTHTGAKKALASLQATDATSHNAAESLSNAAIWFWGLRVEQGVELNGHKLELKMSTRISASGEQSQPAVPRLGKKAKDKSTKIIVRNIPFEASKKEVEPTLGTLQCPVVPFTPAKACCTDCCY